MNQTLKNRRALVTGASRGIGKAIAIELARQGAEVILVARSADALEKVRSELVQGPSHISIATDLMSAEGIQKISSELKAKGPTDIIIHNLGGSAGVFDIFAPAKDWQNVWQFNLGICHELNRLFAPEMIERKWGRIVHISTLSTKTYNGYAPYVSAKCALDGYVKSLSRHLAKHNVIVTAVAPGAIYSEGRHFAKMQNENPSALDEYFDQHLPSRRLGTGADVAAAVGFLCSDQASFMAGAIVPVDGGGM